jgi:hypothetical protein
MSKKTQNQQTKEEIANTPQQLSSEQMNELHEIKRIENMFKFVSELIKMNSALVPQGQEIAKQFECIGLLVTNNKNQYVADLLTAMGYAKDSKVNINTQTGVITPIKENA